MSRKRRFQRPPDHLRSSLTSRLSIGFLLRQLLAFALTDLLLFTVAAGGMLTWAEGRCSQVARLVEERGVPTPEAQAWMEASDYTITPLDREPRGFRVSFAWFSLPDNTAQGLRSYDLRSHYTVELPNGGEPYAITVDLRGLYTLLHWSGVVLLCGQGLVLLVTLLGGKHAIRKVLRPIQELAATASRLNDATHMSRQELTALAGQLEQINERHLDSRISLTATQKELRSLAGAINAMLDRVNAAYAAQMRFVSDASHELRTPIAVIQGYASLLNRWGKDDPQARQESIDAIQSEAQAMERLVEQLLFLARGDNDTQPVRMELFDLNELAGEVLREEEMIHQDRIFLPVWQGALALQADPALIKQVLRIMVDNSVKYSAPGSRVYLRVSPREDVVRVTVQDEGEGISAQSLPHVFDRFYRADQSRDRKTGGTGLGLSIARWIVERHGGWFEVLSRPGVGSRFTFVLPLDRPE